MTTQGAQVSEMPMFCNMMQIETVFGTINEARNAANLFMRRAAHRRNLGVNVASVRILIENLQRDGHDQDLVLITEFARRLINVYPKTDPADKTALLRNLCNDPDFMDLARMFNNFLSLKIDVNGLPAKLRKTRQHPGMDLTRPGFAGAPRVSTSTA